MPQITDRKNVRLNINVCRHAAVLDGKQWRSVMGDDYFSAIKLIACVKYVLDSILCDAVVNRFAHCHKC
jgi:hypothetical protein